MADRVKLTDQALSNLVEHCENQQERFKQEGNKKTAASFSELRKQLLELACREQSWIIIDK